MANNFVELVADGTGKNVQSYLNTISGDSVEAQAIAIQDPTGWTNSYVQVNEGVGKKIQYFSNSISGNTVLAMAVVLVDTTGATI